jgi:hypothetical protein
MLSAKDRQRLLEIIVERADLAGEDGEQLTAQDADTICAWLHQYLSLSAAGAKTLAYAREGDLYLEDLEGLAQELGFHEGLLCALASEASDEILSHAIDDACGHDSSCEVCLTLLSKNQAGLEPALLRELALATLSHVYADTGGDDEDPLLAQMLQLWRGLDRPSQLRVLASAVDEKIRIDNRTHDLDTVINAWFYTHLPLPLRRAVMVMNDRGYRATATQIMRAVPELAPAEKLDATRRHARLLAMFRAAHARLCTEFDLRDRAFEEIVISERKALAIAPVWREIIHDLLVIERSAIG